MGGGRAPESGGPGGGNGALPGGPCMGGGGACIRPVGRAGCPPGPPSGSGQRGALRRRRAWLQRKRRRCAAAASRDTHATLALASAAGRSEFCHTETPMSREGWGFAAGVAVGATAVIGVGYWLRYERRAGATRTPGTATRHADDMQVRRTPARPRVDGGAYQRAIVIGIAMRRTRVRSREPISGATTPYSSSSSRRDAAERRAATARR